MKNDVMMCIPITGILNCTRESRIELLEDIRRMQNKASILNGGCLENICMNLNTIFYLESLFHTPSTDELENILGAGKISEEEFIGDGVIYFK